MRKNGFFWIKTKCMPEPTRVYCDFDDGEGNFYLYQGNMADKVSSILNYKHIQNKIIF